MSNQIITGKVTNEDDEELIGVTVTVQGTTLMNVTDSDGMYSIQTESENALVFSYTGYSPITKYVGSESVINVVMILAVQMD
ncbi:MAG: carboxypeptidase-like regulatory domain-containing protein [Bacteroidota bacterium]